ncbi:hypothetical protein [Bacillus manliponensis]|uniref:hypothetical protein n=1 Tax=Bacillus manliponensis TaxID=574376 RepID=UPI0035153E3D
MCEMVKLDICITDDEVDLKNLSSFVQSLSNVQKIEVLPYHKPGVYKWEALGHKYPLIDVEPPTEELVQKAKYILQAV